MNIEVLLTLIITSLSCSLIGIFLYLNKMSMITDALSHTMVLGVVFGFLLLGTLNYIPLLFCGVLSGFISVILINLLKNTKKVTEDAAIGFIFPLFFGTSILLISLFSRNIPLDADAILLGDAIFIPLNRVEIFNFSLPIYLLGSLFSLLLNVIFIKLFYKELKITIFDKTFALLSGFNFLLIEYLLVFLAAFTCISSANSVGFLLVISLMIGPVVCANILSDKLTEVIAITFILSILNVFLGYTAAVLLDVSVSGMITFSTGVVFFAIFLFSSEKGLIIKKIKEKKRKIQYQKNAILLHLKNHETKDDYQIEANLNNLPKHLNWNRKKLNKIIYIMKKEGLISLDKNIIFLTKEGKNRINYLSDENLKNQKKEK